ncbi:MAG: hypothetical protein OXF68_15455 [Gammaproteobacteria bacterium]|nr:hypothetical protein [Gammaproteobacteria bacterium]MCY4344439.1 hypothetical protein [Gammaproteobacteria bacterium]
MTESLQASGFERRQADATVRAIASSIEKFAVTPEVLRKAFDGHRSDMNARFEDQRADANARFEDQMSNANARFTDIRSDMNHQFEALRAELRAETARLFKLTLSIAMGMAGVAGAMIFDRPA